MRLMSSDQIRMSKWAHELVKLSVQPQQDPELLVEIMGLLANFEPIGSGKNQDPHGETELPWGELADHGILDLLYQCLRSTEDDLILEAVMVVGLI